MSRMRVTTEAEPPPTLPEALTAQFYEWERRGRGWDVWPYRVHLEPRFQPFFHTLPRTWQFAADDGRRPTLLSSLVGRLMGHGRVRSPAPEEPSPGPWAVQVDPRRSGGPLVELEIAVPPSLRVGRDPSEQLLLSLAPARRPVSIELVATARRIAFQVCCSDGDQGLVRQQIKVHFPEAVIVPSGTRLRDLWRAREVGQAAIVDFGLAREFMVPLRTWKTFDADPLVGITGALSVLREDEVGVFQILLQAARHDWSESILRAVTDGEGGSFFADAPQMTSLARDKVAQPLFWALVRVGVRSPSRARAWQIAHAVGGALGQFGTPGLNEFIPLEPGGYDEEMHEEDLLDRSTCRCGVLLNGEELVSFAHLPSESVRSERLARQVRKTKAAPASATAHAYVLGENLHDGETVCVGLSTVQRLRHTYVIGASGTGKSTLLLNLILQDLAQGAGLAVLDPHGDLIDEVLGRVPETRREDVVLLDPSDADFPVGFNILQARTDLEKTLLASDLVGVFRRLATSWGDQMNSVLGNAILAFLERPEGGTLFDLRRFLIEPVFRREVLRTVRDSEVVYYWEKEYPLLAGRPQAPLLTRLDTFLRPRLIRHMVAQKEDRFDVRSFMDGGKIVLAKLAQGAIGEENAYLLGALLVARFHQVALSRQEQDAASRRPFFLYIDEFHNFMTPSMASILSGARKFGLGLVLAHQDLRQISSRDSDVASAVLANPCTRICFRVGDDDARKLAEGFASFDAKDLQSLDVGEAICRIERAEHDFTLSTLTLPAVDAAVAQERRTALVEVSRAKYARPRAEIEAALHIERPAAPAHEPEIEPSDREKPRPTREARAPERVSPAAQPPPRERPMPLPAVPSSPGRGGLDHKYWQSFIKAWADKKGYRATIEKQVLDGSGSVDVVVESAAWSVAFEISVSSTLDQELKNVQKCLIAGFQRVVLVLPIGKAVARAKDHIEAGVGEENRGKIQFVPADELPQIFSALEAGAAGSEGTVRGYKVRVEYKPLGDGEQQDRRRRISDVLVRSLRKFSGKGGKPSGPKDDARA